MKSQSFVQQRQHHIPQESGPSDGMMLGQSLAGDESAFEALVSRYSSSLLEYIRRILKDDEQAHDVLQLVLLQLYVSQPTLLKGVSLKPWLFRVARYRCLDELRKQRRRPSVHFSELLREGEGEGMALFESVPDPQPLPEEVVEQHDLQAALYHAIAQLPLRMRPVVHLRCFEQLTFSEIGHRLKIPASTAKTYFHRSLQHLRYALTSTT